MRFNRTFAASVAALSIFSAACGAEVAADVTVDPTDEVVVDPTDEMTDEITDETMSGDVVVSGTVVVSAQETDGTVVVVESATIAHSDGFLVVHAAVDGAPGEVLGFAAIAEGESLDVTITLDAPLTESAEVFVMLHLDDSVAGEYEFGTVAGADVPVVGDDGAVVMTLVAITLV